MLNREPAGAGAMIARVSRARLLPGAFVTTDAGILGGMISGPVLPVSGWAHTSPVRAPRARST